MVVLSVFLFSYYKADEIKKRFENLKQLKRGLTIIKNEISFSSQEMENVAKELSEILDGDCAEAFFSISENLKENPCKSFGQAWSEAMDKMGKNAFLPVSAKKIMNEFAMKSGQMSKDIEIENIDKTITLLEEEIKAESRESEKNRKLIFSLGGITGLSVLIILL